MTPAESVLNPKSRNGKINLQEVMPPPPFLFSGRGECEGVAQCTLENLIQQSVSWISHAKRWVMTNLHVMAQ